MFKKIILLGLLITGIFSMAYASNTTSKNQSSHAYTEIHTKELKNWYDQNKKMTIVDARSKEYYDGTLISNAIWLPYDASENDLNQALPSKNALLVVYCWSPTCPASKYLVDRLVDKGYTNVYKYPEGLQEWIREGLPTSKK
jgi:rhodanese-related sulfurtransferase